MSQYRTKPVVIQATQWMQNGDHPLDNCKMIQDSNGSMFKSEGQVVHRFRHPQIDGQSRCPRCTNLMHIHGWIDANTPYVVCPGDFIVTELDGAFSPYKPNLFSMLFEYLED